MPLNSDELTGPVGEVKKQGTFITVGDKLVPINVLCRPAMIATAIQVTVAHFYGGAPVRGTCLILSPLIHRANAKEYYYPNSPF